MKEQAKRSKRSSNSIAEARHKKQKTTPSIYYNNPHQNTPTLSSSPVSSPSIQIIASSSSSEKKPFSVPSYPPILRAYRPQPATTQYVKKPPIFGAQEKVKAIKWKLERLNAIAQARHCLSHSSSCSTDLALVALQPFRAALNENLAKKLSANEYRSKIEHINKDDNENRFLLARKRKQRFQSESFTDTIARTCGVTLDTPLPPQPCLPTYKRLQDLKKQLDLTFGKPKIRKRNWRKSLDPEQLALVEKTLSRRTGLISELAAGGYVQAHDIQKLRPRQWINDEIVTFYTILINQRSTDYETNKTNSKGHDENETFLKAHCFNSFFMPKYDQNGYSGVKRWSKKVDLLAKDIVIFPINIGNAHWTCAAINLRAKRFEYFDSMGHQNPSVLANLRDYITNEALAKKNITLDVTDWPNFYYEKLPQQNNSFDCGIFVCQFMDCLSRDWSFNAVSPTKSDLYDTTFDFDQSNMLYFRTKMVYEIATKNFLKEEWN